MSAQRNSRCYSTRLHRHAQLLVLGVKREHHLGQSGCVGRKSAGRIAMIKRYIRTPQDVASYAACFTVIHNQRHGTYAHSNEHEQNNKIDYICEGLTGR